MSDTPLEEIRVKVPAQPEFVHVVRLIACAVAARLDFSFDAVSDIALAVDEAFSHLLSYRTPPSVLMLRLTAARDHLDVVAMADISAETWPGAGAEDSLTWKVLIGLTEDAGFIQDGEGAGIRFVKRLQETGGRT